MTMQPMLDVPYYSEKNFITLENLPYSIRQNFFKHETIEGMEVAESALAGNVSVFKSLMKKHWNEWRNWKYKIENVKLALRNLEEDVVEENLTVCCDNFSYRHTLTVNFLHFIILTRRSKILKCLMDNFEIADEDWMEQVILDQGLFNTG